MKAYSVEVPLSAEPGKGPIHRSNSGFGPTLSMAGSYTLFETFRRGATTFPNNRCVGWRPVDKEGGVGPYKWLTYRQTLDRADHFGSGLERLGACPPSTDPEAKGMRMLGFYAQNRLEWVVGEQGCYRQSIVPVPLYDTLGVDSVEYVVAQTSLTAICCTTKELKTVVQVAARCPSLTKVFLMDSDVDPSLLGTMAGGLEVRTFAQVEALGKAQPAPAKSPSGSDVAFFCYTSGTTGNPKGALITHQGMLSCLKAITDMGVQLRQADVHLSYLPLPHVFERSVQASLYYYGGAVGFYQGDTLKILEDLVALRPTIFPSVPRLLNRVCDKVLMGVEEKGGVSAWLFNKALAAKRQALKQGVLTHPLWDRLVFNGLRAKLGLDRCRVIMTGSAPISDDVMSFLRAALVVPVHEGYGQTESGVAITFTEATDLTTGHVGAPIPANEVRLVDVPGMGYLSSDRVHGADEKTGNAGIKCRGRGEVCFRGPNVFAGYFKMPGKTAETVDEQGWCHTGDIGLWTEDGKLKLIDRKKNIFKLSQGEYVAAEKIENVMISSPLIAQAFIHGDSLQSTLVSVVALDEDAVAAWAKERQLPGDMRALCGNPELMEAVQTQMKAVGKAAKLRGFEFPKQVHLFHEAFSVDNGLLTPTFKLKRSVARDFFRERIDEMYARTAAKAMVKAKL